MDFGISPGKIAAFACSLRRDEESEAQAFLEGFFRALGHAGAIEAGATFEFRVAKKPEWDARLNRLLQELAGDAMMHHPMSGVMAEAK